MNLVVLMLLWLGFCNSFRRSAFLAPEKPSFTLYTIPKSNDQYEDGELRLKGGKLAEEFRPSLPKGADIANTVTSLFPEVLIIL